MRRRPPARERAGLALAFAGALAACDASGAPASPDGPGRPNVLLVTVASLRADHLSTYGHERPTSPAIDALSETAVVFEDAQAHSSRTLPAVASLVTGQVATTHGCWTRDNRLDDAFTTAAELLARAGYRTLGVVTDPRVASASGVGQGFERFDDALAPGADAERVSDEGISLLRDLAASGRPFFLWLHYSDPSAPHVRHGPHTERVATPSREQVTLYDGEIAYTDHHLGRLFAALDELGLSDRTAVVVTSDHGLDLGDEGGSLHSDVVRVPLVLRAPDLAPARVPSTVRIVDVLPTVLELAGLRAPPTSGASLLPVATGEETEPRPALAELRLPEGKHADSLTLGRWKLLVDLSGDRTLLFDRELDPRETTDLAVWQPDVVDELSSHLQILVAQAEILAEQIGGVPPDDAGE